MEIHLKNEGLNVYKAYDGIEALETLMKEEIHLILMDIMMPNLDGLSATLKIREERNIPIILVSAKSQDTDKIIGLNMGADDYITKPFNPLELVARVKSHLRRYISLGNYKEEDKDELRNGELVLNNISKEVSIDGENLKLTPIEYKILELFLRNKGRVFSSKQVYENVWEEPGYNCDRTVAVRVRRIREKTEINQLLTQSLVEMDDLIEKSKLDFIVNTPNEEVFILADGRKTWRVLENLILNILKYSLQGTRVYIDLIKENNKIYIIMKNIDKYYGY